MSLDPPVGSMIDPEPADAAIGAKEAAPESADAQGFTRSDIRHNMLCCISLDATYVMGWQEVGLALAPLLVFLSASNTLIGFVQSLPIAALLGTFVSPWITRRFNYKKWYMLSFNFPMVAALGMLGLVLVMSHRLGVSNAWLLGFVFAMVGTYHFLVGFVQLPAQEFIVSCIPMSHRGRMFGVGWTVGAVGAIAAGSLSMWILAHYGKPMSFGYLFLMMWLLTTIGFIFAIFAKEKPTPVEKSPKAWSKDMLRAAWDNKAFMRYLLYYTYQAVLSAIYVFVPIYAFRELGAPASMAAVFSMISQVGKLSTSSLGGILVDKFGPKRIVPFWPFMIIIPTIPLLLIHNIWGVLIYVAIQCPLSSAFAGTDTVLQYSLPKAEHRAGLFTIFYLVVRVSVLITPVVGYAYDLLPYRTMFFVGIILAVLMFPFIRWFISTLGSTPEAYS